ncbi:MAG: HAD family hydrolase [Gammaproteobacteria bacterium]|nr:HAD family hydrolase [Gammaproteobacteria bacterium]
MSLALFDLDDTLLDGDSDRLWTDYLFDRGILDANLHREKMDDFDRQYHAGALDAAQYLCFSLDLLSQIPTGELLRLRDDFLRTVISPRISAAARSLLAKHRSAGHTLVIITLTNRFVSEPIAAELGVDALLATVPEMSHGQLTGRIVGEPCYQLGKIAHLQAWMEKRGENLDNSYFYSDSMNDLPLLEAVSCPVVVNPDATLEKVARTRGWLIMKMNAERPEQTGP